VSPLLGEALLDVEQQKLDYLKQKQARKSQESDSEESFFYSLLPHVAKIPPERKLLFRYKVQGIVRTKYLETTRRIRAHLLPNLHEDNWNSTGSTYSI
jgi:hypothetical protein